MNDDVHSFLSHEKEIMAMQRNIKEHCKKNGIEHLEEAIFESCLSKAFERLRVALNKLKPSW